MGESDGESHEFVGRIAFRETCARSASASDLFTSKQAKAFISNASPLLLNFNGLAAIASTVQGNDLVPLNFPTLHRDIRRLR